MPPLRAVLLLASAMAVSLVYSLWSARPLWADLALVAVLAGAVRLTWRGWGPAPLRLPALALLGAFTLAALFSDAPLQSWRTVLGVVAYGLVYLLAGNLLSAGVPRATLYRALLLTAQILLVGLAAVWLADGAPFGGYRVPVENTNSFALFTLLLMPAIVTGDARTLVLAEALCVAWLSGSRAGAGGLAAGLLSLRLPVRVPAWALAVLALAVGLALAARADLGASNGRSNMWQVAARMFAESPLVGHGPDTFKAHWVAAYPEWASGHAHNLPLNLAAETGLVGLAAGVWLIGSVLRALARAGGPWGRAALAATVGLLVHSLADVPTTAPYITVTWLALVALGLADD